MSYLEEIQVKNLDQLGIVAGLIDEIGIVKIINNKLGIDVREKISAGTVVNPNFSQNLRSPNTEALQEVGLNRAIADFPNQQSVVRF